MHRGSQRVGTTTVVAEILLLPSFISMAFVASQLNKLRKPILFMIHAFIKPNKGQSRVFFLAF